MSINEKILQCLFEPRYRYRGMMVSAIGIPCVSYKKRTLYHGLNYLKHKNYVTFENNFWKISSAGEKYLKSRSVRLAVFNGIHTKDAPKNLLLMFDVPEDRRGVREWLRSHLRKFDFIMIQKSVWVGPSPLPKEFVSYLMEIKISKAIKTFKLARGYRVK